MAAPSRPVLGLERLWLAADRAWPPFVNQLVVEGEGEVDTGALAAGLARVADAWPAARARLTGWLGRARWSAEGAPPRLTIATAWDGAAPHSALAAPLDPCAGPVVELVVFPGRLVLRTHHAVFDGRAAGPLAEDLGRALRGEPLVGARFAGVGAPPAPTTTAPSPPDDAPLLGRNDPAAGAAPRWARRTLRGPTGQLVARVARALADEGGVPVRVSVPTDTRRWGEPGVVAANLTGFVRLAAAPGEPVAAIAARLAAAVASDEALGALHAADGLRAWPIWLLAGLGQASARTQARRGCAPSTAAVSNLGRQDASWLDHGNFRGRALYWLPPVNPGSGGFITLTGHAGGVELIVGLPGCLAGGGRVDTLADALAASLEGPLNPAAPEPRP
jgi:hypothetical protein